MARNKEFNEQEAITRAMDIFWKKGYSGTSMRDLTNAMQINSSSLYNSIGDKHQLFIKCIENYTDKKIAEVKARSLKIESPLEAITNFINESVNTLLYTSDSCFAIKTTFEVASNDATVQNILKSNINETHLLLVDLINKAIEKNEISNDDTPDTMADFILSSFTGWHESYILHNNPLKIKKMAQYLVKLISS